MINTKYFSVSHIKIFLICLMFLIALNVFGMAMPSKGYILEIFWDFIETFGGYIVGLLFLTLWDKNEKSFFKKFVPAAGAFAFLTVGVLSTFQFVKAFHSAPHNPDYLTITNYDYAMLIIYLIECCRIFEKRLKKDA